ncbi:hypothetical protein PVBG_05224 [Plasmodium vivax Brazil I]|uniref:Uncharacterized protein n=1 Tax=Plasmodium vivax (strain Brazil I) TaxID=1033975 RepID=A0A0J9SJU2_PLAV1|nr:hypothetical protein PVBG_05224 [Plasmodium vivax Brazil I]
MGFSQLKEKVCLQFIFKIIIYKELFEKSFIIYTGDILNLYDKLDQAVVENDQYPDILNLCGRGTLFEKDHTGEYKKFCKKLLNNLLLLTKDDYGGDNFSKYCDILYIWMYFEIKKNNIPDDITKPIFDNSIVMIKTKLRKNPCPYFNFNENYHEPTKLMKLRIFEHNTSTFQNILNNISKPNNCSCLEYVYECINIYKEMNNEFCATDVNKKITYKDTCDILNNFNTSYSTYIQNVNGGIYELPLLSDTTTASHTPTASHVTRCSANKERQELGSGSDVQSSSSKQISISTALSTMVGIPPFLALIYKVNIIHN